MEQKSIHSGHRTRIKERYLASGFDDFSDHEILEMILFYGIPRKDTNELAHRLIDHYGSISAVLEAPIKSLIENGVPENAALLLRLMPQLGQAYIKDKTFNNGKIYDIRQRRKKVKSALSENSDGRVLLILYDTKGMELFFGFLGKEYQLYSDEVISKITELCMKYHALSAIIGQNKYNGIAYPSADDFDVTIRLINSLARIGIHLKDHYIQADKTLFSMAHDNNFYEMFIVSNTNIIKN